MRAEWVREFLRWLAILVGVPMGVALAWEFCVTWLKWCLSHDRLDRVAVSLWVVIAIAISICLANYATP